jgi:AmmeMemoRadiSam system protein B
MGSLVRPKLRALPARRAEHDGREFVRIDDPLNIVRHPILVPFDLFHWVVRHFDGHSTLAEIRDLVRSETGEDVSVSDIEQVVKELDEALVLDGPSFDAYRKDYSHGSVRSPAFAGRSYAASEPLLRAQLASFFDHPDGTGVSTTHARQNRATTRLRGVVSPHIDFGRGGPVYTWAYRELVESCDADVFVVLGVAHQPCSRRFVLTRKHFETPLGVLPTDVDYVNRIASIAGGHLFDDELTHRTEHSIEFQTVFLNYLFQGRRDIEVVPLLVGSFYDLRAAGIDPIEDDEVRCFIEALRVAERQSGKKVAYIGGIDLCHVGPEFGDPDHVDAAMLERIRQFDGEMLERAAANDPRGWFETAGRIDNRWRVCGLAATYTMLHALGNARGRLLKYGQAVDALGDCCVSFASMTFEADRG